MRNLSDLIFEQWHVYKTDQVEMRKLVRIFFILAIALLMLSRAVKAQDSVRPESPTEGAWAAAGEFACAGIAVASIYLAPPFAEEALNGGIWCAGLVAGANLASAMYSPNSGGSIPGDPYNSSGGAANCDPTIDPCGNARPRVVTAALTSQANTQLATVNAARWQDALCKSFKLSCVQ